MTRAHKRPRGFYARYARTKGLSLNAAYRKFNPEKRPCAREKQECDAGPPWDADELAEMDCAFCAAMEREIARGTERPRGSALKHIPETAALDRASASAFAARASSPKNAGRSDQPKTTRPALAPPARAVRPARRAPRAGAASRPRPHAAPGKRDRIC